MTGDALLDTFAEACALDGPLQLIVEGPDGLEGEALHLLGPCAIVGRDAAADVVLNHPDVSRRHVYLQVVAGRVFAASLSTRAGVLWADGPRFAGWLNPGDAIRVGPFALRVRLRPAATADDPPLPTSRAFACPGATDVTLDFAGPDPSPGAWQVSRALVLMGRSTGCRVQLPGPGVAPIHAALVRTPRGAWLVDLRRKGDVLVNGEAAPLALLSDGEIRIGPHRIGVRLGVHGSNVGDTALVPTLGAGRSPRNLPAVADPAMAAVIEGFAQMQDQMADQFQQALVTMFRLFSGMHQDQMTLIREELAQLNDLTREQQALQAQLARGKPTIEPDRRPTLRLVPPEAPGLEPAQRPLDVANETRALPRVVDPSQPQVDPHLVLMQRITALRDERQGRWQKLFGSILGKSSDQASS